MERSESVTKKREKWKEYAINGSKQVIAHTRLGPVKYTPVSPFQSLRVGLNKPLLFHPRVEQGETKAEREYFIRMEVVCRELQLRGASIDVKEREDKSRWIVLGELEARLRGFHARELNARRSEHVNTADKRQGVFLEHRIQRAARRLVAACKDCKCEDVLAALDGGAPATWRLNNGETLLTLFVHLRAQGYLGELIKRGANPQAGNLHGWTPLMMAICYGNDGMVSALLDAGADPNFGRWFGAGQKSNAASPPPVQGGLRGSYDVYDPAGAIAFPGREYCTPLMYASALGYAHLVSILLAAKKINVRLYNNKGRTALMYAVRYRRTDCVRNLCSDKMDVSWEDKGGFSAMDWLRGCLRERGIVAGTGGKLVGDSTTSGEEDVGDVDDLTLAANSTLGRYKPRGGGPKFMAFLKSAGGDEKSSKAFVASALGKAPFGLAEIEMLKSMEEAAARFSAYSAYVKRRVLRFMGVSMDDVAVDRGGVIGPVAKKSDRGKFSSLLSLMVSKFLQAKSMGSNGSDENSSAPGMGSALLLLLEGPKMEIESKGHSEILLHSASDPPSDDEEMDEVFEYRAMSLSRGAPWDDVLAFKYQRSGKLSRSKVVPDASEIFPTGAVLSEKPCTDRLPVKLLEAREKLKSGSRETIVEASAPEKFTDAIVARSVGGAKVLNHLLGSDFTKSKASGQTLAVLPARLVLNKSAGGPPAPLTLSHNPGLAGRGFQVMTGLPLPVRERNIVTALVESSMRPILELLPMKFDGTSGLSPEAEAYEAFKNDEGPASRQANLMSSMRNALILYHKQQLTRLGELAAPVVSMDMQSLTPDDIGDFKAPTDPCDHCESRRAVVYCINCAEAHCEKCTLWLHKQSSQRHHRCRPLLPKGMTEGVLMTRQARRQEAARKDREKLNSFDGFLGRLRKIVRRVKERVAASAEARMAAEGEKSGMLAASQMAAELDRKKVERAKAEAAALVEGVKPTANNSSYSSKDSTDIGLLGPLSAKITGGNGALSKTTEILPAVSLTPPLGPGEGRAAMKATSRVAAYHKWINSVPGVREPEEIIPAVKLAPPPPPGEAYVPPPAILAKLLGLNPTMGKWMGISMTPLFAPPPAAKLAQAPPQHKDLAEGVSEQLRKSAVSVDSPVSSSHPVAVLSSLPLSDIQHAETIQYPQPIPDRRSKMDEFPLQTPASMERLSHEPPVLTPPPQGQGTPAAEKPPPSKDSYFKHTPLYPTLEDLPGMLYIRSRPDGVPGPYTEEVFLEAQANRDAAKRQEEAESGEKLDTRWKVMLEVKAAAIRAGDSALVASRKALQAGEAILSSIQRPFVDPFPSHTPVSPDLEASPAFDATTQQVRQEGTTNDPHQSSPSIPHDVSASKPNTQTQSLLDGSIDKLSDPIPSLDEGGVKSEGVNKTQNMKALKDAFHAEVKEAHFDYNSLRQEFFDLEGTKAAAEYSKDDSIVLANASVFHGFQDYHRHPSGISFHDPFTAGFHISQLFAMNRGALAMILGEKVRIMEAKALCAENKERELVPMIKTAFVKDGIAVPKVLTVKDIKEITFLEEDVKRAKTEVIAVKSAHEMLLELNQVSTLPSKVLEFIRPGFPEFPSPAALLKSIGIEESSIRAPPQTRSQLMSEQHYLSVPLKWARHSPIAIFARKARILLDDTQARKGLILSRDLGAAPLLAAVSQLERRHAKIISTASTAWEAFPEFHRAREAIAQTGKLEEPLRVLNRGIHSLRERCRDKERDTESSTGWSLMILPLVEVAKVLLEAAVLAAQGLSEGVWAEWWRKAGERLTPGELSSSMSCPGKKLFWDPPPLPSPCELPTVRSLQLNAVASFELEVELADSHRLSCISQSNTVWEFLSEALGNIQEAFSHAKISNLPPQHVLWEPIWAVFIDYLKKTGEFHAAVSVAHHRALLLAPATSVETVERLGSFEAMLRKDVGLLDLVTDADAAEIRALEDLDVALEYASTHYLGLCDPMGDSPQFCSCAHCTRALNKKMELQVEKELAEAHEAAILASEKAATDAAHLKSLQEGTDISLQHIPVDSSLHIHPQIVGCLPELEVMLSVPRWATFLKRGLTQLHRANPAIQVSLPGLPLYVDFLLACSAFKATPSTATAVLKASRFHIFKEFLSRPAPLEPIVSAAMREMVEMNFAVNKTPSLFEAAEDAVKKALTGFALTPFLQETKSGLIFLEERCLSLGLPSWSICQVAQLCEPATRPGIVWVQRYIRLWLGRSKERKIARAEVIARKSAKEAEAAAKAERRAKRKAAKFAESVALLSTHAGKNKQLPPPLIAAPLHDTTASEAPESLPPHEATESLAIITTATPSSPMESNISSLTVLEEAGPAPPASIAIAAEEENEEEYDSEVEQRKILERTRELDAWHRKELELESKRKNPPPKAEGDPYAALLASAMQSAEAESEAVEANAEGTQYVAELLGQDPYAAFQSVISRGGTEEEAWATFRSTEKAVRSYEEAFAKAVALGVDPLTIVGASSHTVEQALAMAKAAALARMYFNLPREEAKARALRVLKRWWEFVLAKRATAARLNRMWVPMKDPTSGYYYYVNLNSETNKRGEQVFLGKSQWTLPPGLPASALTFKVICVSCSRAFAEMQCSGCNEAYCRSCCLAVHALRHRGIKRHKCFVLPVSGSPQSALFTTALRLPRSTVLGAFSGSVDGVCLSCERRVGTLYCESCEVVYCEPCWPAMHARGNRARHRQARVFIDTHHPNGNLLSAGESGLHNAEEESPLVGRNHSLPHL